MMVILLVVITKNKLRRNNMHECHYQVDVSDRLNDEIKTKQKSKNDEYDRSR